MTLTFCGISTSARAAYRRALANPNTTLDKWQAAIDLIETIRAELDKRKPDPWRLAFMLFRLSSFDHELAEWISFQEVPETFGAGSTFVRKQVSDSGVKATHKKAEVRHAIIRREFADLEKENPDCRKWKWDDELSPPPPKAAPADRASR